MKIIQEGNPNIIRRGLRFTCKRCGCVFEADFGEYSIEFIRNDVVHSCECPTCCARVVF